MIPAAELAALQAAANLVMDQTITVTRTTSTPTNIGVTEATTSVYSGNALVTKPTAPQLAALPSGVVGDVPTWLVTVPSGTAVKTGDLVTVTGVSGQIFRVQTVLTPQSYSVIDSFLMAAER